MWENKHHPKHVVGHLDCLPLLSQPSAWHFSGETPLAFLIAHAIFAVNTLCLFLNKLQLRVLLCCLLEEAVVFWPSVTKCNSITAACLCLGMKLAFIPKTFQGFFCGLPSSGQSLLPSPLPGCALLLLPPHWSHPLGSGQEAARGSHLLPSPPLLSFLLFPHLIAVLALMRSW